MADTELTVQTLWFSFDSRCTHYFLILYFHRIPFGSVGIVRSRIKATEVFFFFLFLVSFWLHFSIVSSLVLFLKFSYPICANTCVTVCVCTVGQWASGLPFAAYKSRDGWNTACWICVGLADWANDAGYWICYMLVAVMCVQPLACVAYLSGSEPGIALHRKSISTADNMRCA